MSYPSSSSVGLNHSPLFDEFDTDARGALPPGLQSLRAFLHRFKAKYKVC